MCQVELTGRVLTQHGSMGDVRNALDRMDPADGFVIVSRDDGSFMQTTGGVVEYRCPLADKQYQFCTDDRGLIERCFESYVAGNKNYQSVVAWEVLDLS